MNIKCYILLFVAAVIGLSSCKNNDNNLKPVVSSYLGVANASADTINFYLNGTRRNNLTSLYPGGWPGYLIVSAGMQNFQIKKVGNPNYLFSVPINLIDTTNYSIFVTSESASGAFLIKDSILVDKTDPNIATVRFVNAAPDAGSVSAFVGDTVSFIGHAFKTSSGFSPLGSGQKKVKVFLAGAVTPKIDTILAMQPGRAYTLFTKGTLNGKGNSRFNVGLILSY